MTGDKGEFSPAPKRIAFKSLLLHRPTSNRDGASVWLDVACNVAGAVVTGGNADLLADAKRLRFAHRAGIERKLIAAAIARIDEGERAGCHIE